MLQTRIWSDSPFHIRNIKRKRRKKRRDDEDYYDYYEDSGGNCCENMNNNSTSSTSMIFSHQHQEKIYTRRNVFNNLINNTKMLFIYSLLLIAILLLCSNGGSGGNGLHNSQPQCHWSLYQDIERLNCIVENGGGRTGGNNLIVEEEIYGIGPEHAKSLWIQCTNNVDSSFNSDLHSDNSNYNDPDSFQPQDEGYQQQQSSSSSSSHHHHHHNHRRHHNTRDHHHQQQHHDQQLEIGGGGGYVLSHGVFMAVPNLRDLKIEHCHIKGITPGALGYLPYLQNLTIRAHTSLTTWPSTSSSSSSSSSPSSTSLLDIKPGVFRDLPELRYLDLSTTSLSSLPNDFLCFLPSLYYLNLSSCYLRDFRSIGITTPVDPTNPQLCGNNIQVLDLSHNHFTLLPPATFSSIPKLEELRIEGNSITIAAERALLGLVHLKIFSMASNQLTSLPPEFFKDNRELKEIYLQNNSLSVLAPGLFNYLQNVVVLDLSNNELTSEWVNGETFRGLVRLIVLNLANNELSKIDSILFRDLSSLQVLNLENNKISSIAENSFSGMYNIHTLLLSHNQLTTIDHFICNGLFVLSFLALDNNKIESVDSDSFKNCSSLTDLNLSGNKLTTIPNAINSLILLRTLDLGENKITELGPTLNSTSASDNSSTTIATISTNTWSKNPLPQLYGLRLTDNLISHVPANAFINLPSLKIVNLAKNNISVVEPGAFDNSLNLQAIRLDSNRLKDITGLFKNIPNLLWLNISGNLLEDLQYVTFPPKLQWLDLRSNKIHTLGSCLDIDNKLRIRNLDLSENYLTEIGSSNIPDSIENLIISSNKIHHIQPYSFFRKHNLTRIDLASNNLSTLDQNAFRLSPNRANTINVEILLGFNPLQCDCTMEWIQSLQNNGGGEISSPGQYPIIQDVEDVKCTLSFDRLFEPVSYLNISTSQFLCKYESHCFSSCTCCDFDACDCEMTCPKNCSCYHDQSWQSTNVVDCSMLEQSFIPGRIPMDVTDLYLDGNILPSLDSHAFIGRKNLRTLYLNGSRIEIIQNRTFHGLKALQVLHLENNYLERLEGFEFEELENLEELYLHKNSLNWISNDTFIMLTRLRILTLHSNNFVNLPIWQVVDTSVRLSMLSELTLSGNEWSCNCLFTQQFKDWLLDRENRAKISDASQIQCIDQVSSSSTTTTNNKTKKIGGNSAISGGVNSKKVNYTNSNSETALATTELVIIRILDQRNHRCSESTDLSIREPSSSNSNGGNDNSGKMNEYIVLIVSLSSVLIFIILVSIIVFYWRQSLRVWAHDTCGLRILSNEPQPNDKLFDAFISYSSKDEAWVRQVLAAELERNDPPYRLCLRYRDLPTGGNYLADTLSGLIVQAAEASKRTVLVLSHHFLKGEWSRVDVKAAHQSLLKDRTRKVIIILLGDFPSKDIYQDVRLYLKNHTYLNCEDKRFWQKLRYALPDVKVKGPLARGLHNRTSTNSHHPQQQQQTQRRSHSHHLRSNQPPPPPPPMHHPHHQHQQQLQLQQQLLHQQQQLLQQQSQYQQLPQPQTLHHQQQQLPPLPPLHHQQLQRSLNLGGLNVDGGTNNLNGSNSTISSNSTANINNNNNMSLNGGRGSMTRGGSGGVGGGPAQRHSSNANRHLAIHI